MGSRLKKGIVDEDWVSLERIAARESLRSGGKILFFLLRLNSMETTMTCKNLSQRDYNYWERDPIET